MTVEIGPNYLIMVRPVFVQANLRDLLKALDWSELNVPWLCYTRLIFKNKSSAYSYYNLKSIITKRTEIKLKRTKRNINYCGTKD